MPKIVKRLSDKEIEAAKPQEKDYKLFDGEGLCLLVRTSGTKVWQYPYVFKGRSTIFTIGKYHKDMPGTIGLKMAREKRYEVRALLDQGIDPNAQKQARRSYNNSETTFEALGREWHSKGTWVTKHARNILKSLEDDIFPLIGTKEITKITRQDIVTVLTNVEKRGACDVAKRICQRCEAIFDYAITKGVCEDNPALGRSKIIQKPKTKNRPYLKEKDLPEFLYNLESYHGRNYVKIAMQLLVLTFMRPGELRNTRWTEVDFEKAIIKIPANRMKMARDHIVPLSRQALSLLQELQKITGKNELLFPGIKNNGQPISDVTLTKVLIVMGYQGRKKVVPHGFRHTASTILNEHGKNQDHIERQLAHAEKNKVRGTYNHAEYLTDRKEMMQWYADHLDYLRGKYEGRSKEIDS